MRPSLVLRGSCPPKGVRRQMRRRRAGQTTWSAREHAHRGEVSPDHLALVPAPAFPGDQFIDIVGRVHQIRDASRHRLTEVFGRLCLLPLHRFLGGGRREPVQQAQGNQEQRPTHDDQSPAHRLPSPRSLAPQSGCQLAPPLLGG